MPHGDGDEFDKYISGPSTVFAIPHDCMPWLRSQPLLPILDDLSHPFCHCDLLGHASLDAFNDTTTLYLIMRATCKRHFRLANIEHSEHASQPDTA